MSYGNTAPYYEWGRKDPLRPSTGLGNVNKPIFGLYTTPGTISSTAIDVTIRNPHYFNSSNGNTSLELWNVGNTVSSINVNPVIKSIYDPSPAGFRVPCSGATQSWTDSGRSFCQSTIGQQGRYFYQLAPTTGEAFFFLVLVGEVVQQRLMWLDLSDIIGNLDHLVRIQDIVYVLKVVV
jgi:hypothetical protein